MLLADTEITEYMEKTQEGRSSTTTQIEPVLPLASMAAHMVSSVASPEDSDSEENRRSEESLEGTVPLSQEEPMMSSDSASSEDKETSSSSQQSRQAGQPRAGTNGQETSQRKPREVSERGVKSGYKRGDGPPAKKSRREKTEGEQSTLGGGSGGQRVQGSDASPELRPVGTSRKWNQRLEEEEEEGRLMKNNNNVQDPHIQQVNKRREDNGGSIGEPGCDKTPTEKTTEKRSQHLDLVEHASQCKARECSRQKCGKMKGFIGHIRDNRSSGACKDKDCKICPAINRLLTEHAKLCKVRSKIEIISVRGGLQNRTLFVLSQNYNLSFFNQFLVSQRTNTCFK